MNISARRILFSELTFWVALCGLCLYFLMPLRQSLRFGIDLVGGTYLTLEVQVEKAVEATLVEHLQTAERLLKDQNLAVSAKDLKNNSVQLELEDIQSAQSAAELLKERLKNISVSTSNKTVTLSLPDMEIARIKREAVERDVEVLRTRMGTAEMTIAQQGERNIIVELPDTANPQEAKARLGKAAQLELRLVEKVGPSKEDIILEYDGDVPTDKEVLPGKQRNEFYLVERFAQVSGNMLKDARATFGGASGVEPVVSFSLNDVGAEKFYEITGKNYGKQLAIVLDGIVISAPRINEPIKGGSGVISGQFTPESAKELALLLTSGSFVAPVTFEEERQIGPTLGSESIRQGLLSCLVGLGLLFVFSLLYYRVFGLFAFLALLYNLVLILVGLAWLQSPLTLPGIAGMVLTVGMAIDASILIFEHIRSELEKGSPMPQSIKAGFSDAMTVILDANITTFIVGVVLFYFGTGPIKGFAVTMMLGIIATLMTGLFFLRSLFNFVLHKLHVQNLKI